MFYNLKNINLGLYIQIFMKLYISGFKNISYNILVGYLSNYYMYHISSKYINTMDEIKHNMPFKINYFLYNNYCFLTVYNPFLYYHLLNNHVKFKAHTIINNNGYLTRHLNTFTFNIKKFKQIKFYLVNISQRYGYKELYNMLNKYVSQDVKYSLKLKIDYYTGRHNGICEIKIYNNKFYDDFVRIADILENDYKIKLLK